MFLTLENSYVLAHIWNPTNILVNTVPIINPLVKIAPQKKEESILLLLLWPIPMSQIK
jgi:hypothetical protein